MSAPWTAALAALTTLATFGACHVHRATNAPGLVEPRVPPAQLADETVATPGDPGERMIAVSPGVLGGAFFGGHGGGFDLAAEVTINWGDSEHSHNDHELRLMLPKSLQFPERAQGVALGWSALRVVERDDGDTDVTVGPLYLDAQLVRGAFGAGVGWTFDPVRLDHGPEIYGWAGVFQTRLRWGLEDGFEIVFGYQLKWPFTWVTSR